MRFDFRGTLEGFSTSPGLAPRGKAAPRSGCLLLLLATLAAASCAKPKSFLVVKLESGTPITGITRVVVDVKQGNVTEKVLTYRPDVAITIDQDHPTDFSVNFSGGLSGSVSFEVSLYNAFDCKVGSSQPTPGIIKGGGVAEIIVALTFLGDCSVRDAGADATGDAFPGCNPVTPNCGPGKTCQVNCDKRVGECTTGGAGLPGSTCTKNADCAPGSQCFDYSGTGCGVKICLRFCDGDGVCSAGGADGGASSSDGGGTGAAAVGTKSLCLGPVQCGGVVTAYRTCTFACDPRQGATAAKQTGCPTGLACLIVGDMDQVDCACPEATRTGTDGVACTSSAQCAPGYICNMMSGARVCRAICRCDAKEMTCTAAANDCGAGKTCSALTNDTTFGVCL
jgi:hypothetical protein